jgi:hypothetical protein
MTNGLIERIVRAAGVPDLVQVLAERLRPTELQSLLLDVYRRAARKTTPARLLEQYERNRFVAPSPVDPRKVLEVERLAWQLLPAEYVPLELSPVCPLGTNSVIASVDQNKVVSTIRNTEVVADTTNVLALEAAVRRRRLRGIHERRREPVLLAASQRLTRAQVFQGPQSFAHFRVIALCAAGRDEGSFDFETERILEHLAYHLNLLRQLVAAGAPFVRFRVAITELAGGVFVKDIENRVLTPLSEQFPEASCHFDPSRSTGRGYYQHVCFKIHLIDRDGVEMEVGDGGLTDWTQQLISDRKERLLISGIGVDRLCLSTVSG